jgi:hypothetical protein
MLHLLANIKKVVPTAHVYSEVPSFACKRVRFQTFCTNMSWFVYNLFTYYWKKRDWIRTGLKNAFLARYN